MICVSNIKSNSLCFNEVVHKEFHWVDRCLWIMTKEGQKNHHIWHILERKRCSDSNRNLRPLVEETTGSQRESGTSSKHVGGVFKKYKFRMLLLLLGVWWCHVSCLRACGFSDRCGNLLRAVISISAVISMRGTRFPGIITSYPDKLKIIRIILGEESEIGFGTTENRSKTGRRTKRWAASLNIKIHSDIHHIPAGTIQRPSKRLSKSGPNKKLKERWKRENQWETKCQWLAPLLPQNQSWMKPTPSQSLPTHDSGAHSSGSQNWMASLKSLSGTQVDPNLILPTGILWILPRVSGLSLILMSSLLRIWWWSGQGCIRLQGRLARNIVAFYFMRMKSRRCWQRMPSELWNSREGLSMSTLNQWLRFIRLKSIIKTIWARKEWNNDFHSLDDPVAKPGMEDFVLDIESSLCNCTIQAKMDAFSLNDTLQNLLAANEWSCKVDKKGWSWTIGILVLVHLFFGNVRRCSNLHKIILQKSRTVLILKN